MVRDLIVGDESSVRSTLRRTLEDMGHRVMDAGDGRGALRRKNRQSAHRTRHMKSRCLYEPYRMPHDLRKNRESNYGRF